MNKTEFLEHGYRDPMTSQIHFASLTTGLEDSSHKKVVCCRMFGDLTFKVLRDLADMRQYAKNNPDEVINNDRLLTDLLRNGTWEDIIMSRRATKYPLSDIDKAGIHVHALCVLYLQYNKGFVSEADLRDGMRLTRNAVLNMVERKLTPMPLQEYMMQAEEPDEEYRHYMCVRYCHRLLENQIYTAFGEITLPVTEREFLPE